MLNRTMPILFVLAMAAAFGSGACVACADEPAGELAQFYGFGRLELYKLQQRSANMLAADLNGDGRQDLILIDNSNSRLDLLQQRSMPAAATKPSRVNIIENDKRFDHRKIPVDREVAALAVGDFNSDGRKDLAWFAVPDQLVVVYQSEQADFTGKRRFRLPDVQPAQWILAAGDVNGDQRDDLVILGKHDTYIVQQQANAELAAPVRLMNTTDNLGLAQIADLDGDGRNDLCYLNASDPDRPLCVRLQGADGRLGPELRCELAKTRGVTIADIDGMPGQEILAIEAQTGRVKVYHLERPEAQPHELAGQLIQFGFGQQGVGKNRDLAVADVDADGRTDVVVTDPESAQMIVFLQQGAGGLDLGNTFPGLVGAEQVRIGDLDGDKRADIVVLSSKEKTIGISQMESGRLTFPQGLPIDREPVAIDLADLNGDGRVEIAYVARERTGQQTKYFLQALTRLGGAEWRPFRFGEAAEVAVTLKATPDRLLALDANRDGRTDFLVFAGSDRAPVFLATNSAGIPAEVPAAEGGFGLGNVGAGGMFLGQLEQPVVLVALNNFARNVVVNEKGQWQVLDQYNAPESGAKIVGAATIDLDGQPGREIVLIDQGVRKLRVLRREGIVYRPWREVDTGAFTYKATHVADLNGDGREDLLLFGDGKFAVLFAGRSDPRLKTVSTYETKLERVHFNDLAVGDLNADGMLDVAVVDTQSQYLEILNFNPETGLRHALHFKVFEAKNIVAEERGGNEPRELLITDLTGDGRQDLVLLSHDRVLLYPQDDGKPDATAAPAAEANPPAGR
jgi:hypothetical protein